MRRSPDDAVELAVNGSSYSRWLSVDLDSDIFTPADAFEVRARAPGADLVGAFREGMSLDVFVGGDRQMAGVIDEVRLEGTRTEETLSLVGRDKGAWLVDSEAPTIRVGGMKTEDLVAKLLQPAFGIRNVIFSYESDRKLAMGKKDRGTAAGTTRRTVSLFGDAPRAATKVDNGMRIAAQLDHHLRQIGVTWWMTPRGDLYIGKPNYHQDVAYRFLSYPPDAALSLRRNNNVERWSVVRSIQDRFSKITVVGTSGSTGRPTFGQAAATRGGSFKASATDPDLVQRGIVRETIMGDGDCLNSAQAQMRADAEMGQRRLRGLTINVTVADFRNDDGRLYGIDTLATVKIPTAGIDGVFYVVQRRLHEERARRRTELTLHQPGVWLA